MRADPGGAIRATADQARPGGARGGARRLLKVPLLLAAAALAFSLPTLGSGCSRQAEGRVAAGAVVVAGADAAASPAAGSPTNSGSHLPGASGGAVTGAGGSSTPVAGMSAGPSEPDPITQAAAGAGATTTTSAGTQQSGSQTSGVQNAGGTGLTQAEAAALEAQLAAIEQELDSISLPSDDDFAGIESELP